MNKDKKMINGWKALLLAKYKGFPLSIKEKRGLLSILDSEDKAYIIINDYGDLEIIWEKKQ